MSDTQGRASIRLYTPDQNGDYTHKELARGIPWDEARAIVVRLLGGQDYSHDIYMGEFYFFGDRIPKNNGTVSSYYYIFDPHPEIRSGDYAFTAPERWVDDTLFN